MNEENEANDQKKYNEKKRLCTERERIKARSVFIMFAWEIIILRNANDEKNTSGYYSMVGTTKNGLLI